VRIAHGPEQFGALGHTVVRRCARGADRNWYVAVEYTQLDPNDRDRLDRLVGEADPPTS
jgi:hypothetical protein